MASAETMAAVKSRLAAGFTSAPVYFPNGALPATGLAEYVAVQYPLASERQASFGAPGSNVFREEGVIRFVFHVRAGLGTDRIGILAGELRTLFRNARFDGVRTYAPTSPVFDDRADAGSTYRASIAVPYDFDSFA
ncbi:MAG: hypothetical protein C0458_04315 [Methylobacterium sp.]|nr:hypothetical protein [Methylobacterium sp.]